MIVITGATGATGALGGAATDHLLEHLPADQVAVVARTPQKARRFAARGVQVRYGDYSDAASLPDAFADAEQLLLVSSNDPSADAVALHRTAVEAAVKAGVGRILYTSHQGAAAGTPFGPGRDHAATEDILAASGVPWTSLRNGFYMHSLQWLLGPWRDTGRISVPADGPVSWTSREDAARAAAVVIVSGASYDGPITLTAADAPTFEEVAAIASQITGRPVQVEVLDADEWLEAQLTAGGQEPIARFILGMYQAAAGGYFAGTDPLLGRLLRHAPQSVENYLAAS